MCSCPYLDSIIDGRGHFLGCLSPQNLIFHSESFQYTCKADYFEKKMVFIIRGSEKCMT